MIVLHQAMYFLGIEDQDKKNSVFQIIVPV